MIHTVGNGIRNTHRSSEEIVQYRKTGQLHVDTYKHYTQNREMYIFTGHSGRK